MCSFYAVAVEILPTFQTKPSAYMMLRGYLFQIPSLRNERMVYKIVRAVGKYSLKNYSKSNFCT